MSRIIGIIPLRAGSKRILNKNKKIFGYKPLYQWILDKAMNSKLDEIIIYTDDKEIQEQVFENYITGIQPKKVTIINREESSDKETTEEALLELFEKINWDFSHFILMQATSPFTKIEDINNIIYMFKFYDSIVSVVNQKRFIWNNDGFAINYNPNRRPLSQNYEGHLIENGALYGTSKELFKLTKCRVSGNIGLYQMSEETYLEIDTPNDWIMAESLINVPIIDINKDLSNIKLIFVDVDGTLTNGKMKYGDHGEFGKEFNTDDGLAVKLLIKNNIETYFISGEDTLFAEKRALKIGAGYILGTFDKLTDIKKIAEENKLSREEVLYVGNSLNDYECMKWAGYSFCPKDAISLIKKIANIVLDKRGGEGILMDIAINILGEKKILEMIQKGEI